MSGTEVSMHTGPCELPFPTQPVDRGVWEKAWLRLGQRQGLNDEFVRAGSMEDGPGGFLRTEHNSPTLGAHLSLPRIDPQFPSRRIQPPPSLVPPGVALFNHQ
ncbi:uncharacterized protein CLUP02_17895 [Colletotrichum lupini]|uniref:Uncharacterized protein n=1 Tax=Colletotrichum lupini TaxID=145971 RepID=A0A9Q8SH35_9PEZI|nr:uncharacterized protein CLUP02_17895 [Colletotrichum lupini]UQC76382.1 hypothetical protein CLUP02_17895 [Colletotrichum lupini]